MSIHRHYNALVILKQRSVLQTLHSICKYLDQDGPYMFRNMHAHCLFFDQNQTEELSEINVSKTRSS